MPARLDESKRICRLWQFLQNLGQLDQRHLAQVVPVVPAQRHGQIFGAEAGATAVRTGLIIGVRPADVPVSDPAVKAGKSGRPGGCSSAAAKGHLHRFGVTKEKSVLRLGRHLVPGGGRWVKAIAGGQGPDYVVAVVERLAQVAFGEKSR